MSGSSLPTIVKRNGQNVYFDTFRIYNAVKKAFLSENNQDELLIESITQDAVSLIARDFESEPTIHVEKIQDIVEAALMKNGLHKIARNYILYRERQTIVRQEKVKTQIAEKKLLIRINTDETVPFDAKVIEEQLRQLAPDLLRVSITEMVESISTHIYDLIPQKEIDHLILSAARDRIERHYEYSSLAARVAVNHLYASILNNVMHSSTLEESYSSKFADYIHQGIDLELLNPELQTFDLQFLASEIKPERDKLFHFLGIQILVDRYLIRNRDEDRLPIELPQWFWMRVAMGLALNEDADQRNQRTVEFYHVLSKMDLVSSTPTLFNSGTCHSQMSSCYLNTVPDSLDGIFKLYGDNAQLSKWAGGIGTDWTPIRSTGSSIHGTNGQSQGVIPFIKIFNDVALAVNQGGKRKGAMCAYLEVWHKDIDQFLELKKNTGDERRRAHDINTAAWIPDLFMKRVESNEDWTLFCPKDVPDLHDLYGKEFEERYAYYETQNISGARTIKAQELWRKLLTMLFETGHPWVTFKDTINVRNPQGHVGTIHSSNLCTEITLNTSKDETAVCNLASVNLAHMITDGKINRELLEATISTGIRMLDNVIDNNFYPTKEAKTANMKHRAIGLGMMGYQDALFQLNIPFDSDKNVAFADQSMELVSYYAIQASMELAKERGSYSTFKGSLWDQGIFPLDSLKILEKERGQSLSVDKESRLDWPSLKKDVQTHGIRNCNTMAIAPTATIANISGVYPCTEPVFKNVYMKENLSGNFIVINRYLIDDLERLNMWNSETLSQIKANNGSIQQIDGLPETIKAMYKETFEIDSQWIILAAAKRSKWIDQSASTNIFMNTVSGRLISDTYKMAWKYGLKTTYYLRSLAASQVTKTSNEVEQASATPQPAQQEATKVCAIDDPDCEACQ